MLKYNQQQVKALDIFRLLRRNSVSVDALADVVVSVCVSSQV